MNSEIITVEYFTYKLRDKIYDLLRELADTVSETGSDYDIVILPRIEEVDPPGTMFLIQVRRYMPIGEDVEIPRTVITVLAFSDGTGRIRIYYEKNNEQINKEINMIVSKIVTMLEAEKIEE